MNVFIRRRTNRRSVSGFSIVVLVLLASILAPPSIASAQRALETPLRQGLLTLLTNEISGQVAFNNLVKLAGAPWLRDPAEFSSTFYEAEVLYDLVRGYGIETVSLDQFPREGTFSYATEGEFWIVEPEPRLVASLGADVAMIASGSQSGEVTGELIYVPQLSAQAIQRMSEGHGSFEGKVALMWSHPRGDVFDALDAAGVRAVISFNSRERYLDPNQVVYSRGGYASGENLRMGMTVSWRQWSELLEDVERDLKLVVRLQARIEEFPDRYEMVVAWISGTEPEAPGVMFTGHLYEGYTKRGTNDNMGGPAIQLEILRALTDLIDTGQIARPRRTIYFLWPNEISGTYEFFRQNPGFADRLSINVNMDMVSENLRLNNSVFTMSETPAHLPSYLDGLAKSVLNYVWLTNDIVYGYSLRGRPGGQYFHRPMWEKNGSGDAFRFYIHEATGGSDHICFNNASVAVPGIEFFTWPDQWYHADSDLPDKSDPTEMKRVAFIGAATALVAADLTDERLPRLLDAVSEFGYSRVAERGLPQAMRMLEGAAATDLEQALQHALNRVNAAVDREIGALESVREIYTGSRTAQTAVDNRIAQWELYREGLANQVVSYVGVRASALGTSPPSKLPLTAEERRYSNVFPDIHPDVMGMKFYLNEHDQYNTYRQTHPEAFSELGLSSGQTRGILNFVNGQRSATEIRNRVAAMAGDDLTVAQVAGYLSILEEVGWLVVRGEL
ncbi:MAG: M28 family peptidase [Gemmatimonadota bacterium]|nr:MAG: M28 family peptidase [Gemmatimonadota bacterium]